MEAMMYHVFAVLNGQVPKFPVASLKSFDTKEKMWQAVESNQELAQVYKLAKMISEAKGGLFTGLKYLKDNLTSQEQADYVVSTIHASKGLGFTKVVIGDDFLPYRENPDDYYELVEALKEDNAMTSLLYVGITRGMKEVVLPSYLEGVL
jgi:superfamily I DNA/RNA helicase